jgi:hypothetical protein
MGGGSCRKSFSGDIGGSRILRQRAVRKEFDHHAWGVTIFPDDGTDPLIVLRADLNLVESTEIIAHELAHVIVGGNVEHNEIFELKFEELHRVYDEIANTIKVAK